MGKKLQPFSVEIGDLVLSKDKKASTPHWRVDSVNGSIITLINVDTQCRAHVARETIHKKYSKNTATVQHPERAKRTLQHPEHDELRSLPLPAVGQVWEYCSPGAKKLETLTILSIDGDVDEILCRSHIEGEEDQEVDQGTDFFTSQHVRYISSGDAPKKGHEESAPQPAAEQLIGFVPGKGCSWKCPCVDLHAITARFFGGLFEEYQAFKRRHQVCLSKNVLPFAGVVDADEATA